MTTDAKTSHAFHHPTKRDLAFREWCRACPYAEWMSFSVLDVGDEDLTYSVHFNLKLEMEGSCDAKE